MSNAIKILYLHTKDNWSLHNVGKFWLDNIPGIEVSYKDGYKIEDESELDRYDLVWFGFLDMYFEFNYDPAKSIIAVHDPFELFPQERNWKSIKPYPEMIDVLRQSKHVVTTSEEMKDILGESGVSASIIQTCSSLPAREEIEINTSKCDLFSVCAAFPRKDLVLLEKIMDFCKDELEVCFKIKFGTNNILSLEDYLKFIDDNEIYVCTSFQEGGPLTAMDAMRRGAVVVTTPVGQIQEIIEDGKNGFICSTKEEFYDRIKFLSKNLDSVQRMRLASLETIKQKRNENGIRQSVINFIDEFRN